MTRVRHLLHPALPITSGARATALAVLAVSLLGAAGVVLQDKAPEAPPKPGEAPRKAGPKEKRSLEIQIQGDVKLNGEAPDPVVVTGTGKFQVKDKKAGKSRAYTATQDQATYTVDGQATPIDKDGKDWLREVVKQIKRDQAGHHGERVVEIDARHLDDLETHARDLERHAQELEAHAQSLSPEERERIHAEMARARAELDKAHAEHRKVRIQVIEKEGGEPGTVVIQKDGEGKRVIVKRLKTKQDEGPEEQEVILDGLDQDMHIPEIHIPRIRVHAYAHPGGEDPRAEMADIQAELKALQTRLDQLQQQLATTPKPPRPPHPTHPLPPPPPPPPPAPEAPPEPPAPPAPPAPPSNQGS